MLTRPLAQPKPLRRLMSRDQFLFFAANPAHPIEVLVPRPYDLVPCSCRDVNCHGWRFVEQGSHVSDVSDVMSRPSAWTGVP